MGKFFQSLTLSHREFIAEQKIYFTASAPHDGRVNLSPKGMDTFRVLSDSRVGYLDITGSGNETAAHLAENGRMTFMFCAFSTAPIILRLYARGEVIRSHHDAWPQLRPLFGPKLPGERQLIIAEIESVQSSCGFGVPFFDYQGDRDQLVAWAERKGPEGIENYWCDKNVRSIDGLPTGILAP